MPKKRKRNLFKNPKKKKLVIEHFVKETHLEILIS